MPDTSDVKWFKEEFGSEIIAAATDTPFDLDMLTALACQETGYIWASLRRKGMPRDQILQLCVGDTLDRSETFPKDRADLETVENGGEMFAHARAALEALAKHIKDYEGAASNPNKFCKGFGIFQYDLQFFSPKTASYFLGGYADFGISLKNCLKELKEAMERANISAGTKLTDKDKAAIAIAYNTGHYIPSKGLYQGYKPKDGPYYGQSFYNYLQLAHSVLDTPRPAPAVTAPGNALLPAATGVAVNEPYIVATLNGLLNVRSSPEKKDEPSNVIRGLPVGHPVSVISTSPTNGFLQIETNLQGAHITGWAFAEFLKPAPATSVIETLSAQLEAVGPTLPAVNLPLRAGTVIRRTEPANAGSLNEGGQPNRNATTPERLREQIAEIIEWLSVDDPAHKRYQPRDDLTFCNIYAHDFCHLAGAYLPRVWWSPASIAKLAAGSQVEPRYGATIDELRANDLFRWLRDFGLQFGWRQTGTLTKLQLAANSGGIGLIVARRKEDGRSGHIVMVVPETEEQRASWNDAGEVTAPLQSQAGAKNFRYGTGVTNWWQDSRFAEFSFWIHP